VSPRLDIQIEIDRTACIGSRACVRRAPATFSLGDDGRAQASDPPADDEATLREVAGACPTFAIRLHETQ